MKSLGRLFGDLKVRPKLIILHNTFFIVLASAVYFWLIPLFEKQIANARLREISLITQIFSEDRALSHPPGLEIYDYRQGSAEALGIPIEIRQWLDAHPGQTWQDPSRSHYCYRKSQGAGLYRSLKLPYSFYEAMAARVKWSLFLVLGIVYVLAVLLLELFIMPRYVYRPIRTLLEADSATQRDDRQHELIDQALIPDDEIGQIMRSRNATVMQLRKHERELAQALARLEEVAEGLRQKNRLLEAAKKSLADRDRLVSLGLLSASLAHELNTPLSVLQGSIEKLMETFRDEHTQERLQRMARVTQRLRRLSESLLDFARAPAQAMGPVSLRSIVDESWALVAIDKKAVSVRFSNQVRQGDAVYGNADRLIQVFVNLLQNSLYAIQSSGSIVVQSRRISDEEQEWIAVSVEDDGVGIPADVLPNIFEAFVTNRLDARGTGLGLTVAEGIVYLHGGTIEAANRPSGGASLNVRLPATRTEVIA